MNKTELAGQIAERAGVSAVEAGRVLDATLQSTEAALAAGEEVSITGFGKFSVSDRAARQGVNPGDRRADGDCRVEGAALQRRGEAEGSRQGLTWVGAPAGYTGAPRPPRDRLALPDGRLDARQVGGVRSPPERQRGRGQATPRCPPPR
jgi:DNA-binding protein HU-beta